MMAVVTRLAAGFTPGRGFGGRFWSRKRIGGGGDRGIGGIALAELVKGGLELIESGLQLSDSKKGRIELRAESSASGTKLKRNRVGSRMIIHEIEDNLALLISKRQLCENYAALGTERLRFF